MTVIIEALDLEWARGETLTGHFVVIHRKKIPEKIQEGRILTFSQGSWVRDLQIENQRRVQVTKLMDDLFI